MHPDRPRLEPIDGDQLSCIHDTALRLLSDTGISVQHAGASERLHGLGCRVENDRVYIPPEVVQSCLASIKPYDTFYSPDGAHNVRLGDGAIRFHNGGGPAFVVDLDTGKRRLACLQDIADASRLLDALPNVDVVIPIVSAQDVAPEMMMVASADAMLRNTRKPVSAAAAEKPEDVRYLVAQAAACCGGEVAFRARPTTAIMVSPVSPLTFTEQVTSTIIAVAESGAGLQPLPAPSLGATGPLSMAGIVAQQHAETLAAFVIAASVNPEIRVTCCSRVSAIDLRSAVSIWGSPEVGLTAAITGQLAHSLGLPCDAYGLCSTADMLDPQYAYERFANAYIPGLSGMDLMSGVGILGNNLVASLQAAVIDNEMIGILKHIVRGIPVSGETLAYELMQEVIPADGVFLAETHTVRYMRQGALWRSSLGGAGDVVERAGARARDILRTHTVEPLPSAVLAQLDEIMAEATREMTVTA